MCRFSVLQTLCVRWWSCDQPCGYPRWYPVECIEWKWPVHHRSILKKSIWSHSNMHVQWTLFSRTYGPSDKLQDFKTFLKFPKSCKTDKIDERRINKHIQLISPPSTNCNKKLIKSSAILSWVRTPDTEFLTQNFWHRTLLHFRTFSLEEVIFDFKLCYL